jgi:ubiquinone/menaquinone biosynthesis C-methylase UbiE
MDSNQSRRISQQYASAANLEARIALHVKHSTNKVSWMRWLFDNMEFAKNASILELGCGTGLLWHENLDRIDSSWTVHLTDLSEGMLDATKKGLRPLNSRFSFAQMNAEALSFPSGTFDGVIANHMLYHVPNRKLALQEIRRVLKPGGTLYASTNGRQNLIELRDPQLLAILHPTGMPATPIFGNEGAKDWFYLENGEHELREVFDKVSILHFVNQLHVTNIDDLVAYHGSYGPMSASAATRLREYYEARKTPEGVIPITKSSGLMVAKADKGADT